MNDDGTFTISIGDSTYTNTSTSTSTYSIIDSTMNLSDITFNTTSDSTITIGTDHSGEVYNILDKFIDPDEVENMCKEYPALSKVWRNFKSVYDMTLQDYNGKKEQEKYT